MGVDGETRLATTCLLGTATKVGCGDPAMPLLLLLTELIMTVLESSNKSFLLHLQSLDLGWILLVNWAINRRIRELCLQTLPDVCNIVNLNRRSRPTCIHFYVIEAMR